MRTQRSLVSKYSGERNWFLFLGLGITLMVILLAWVGPHLAGRDPMETVGIIRVGDRWLQPPFAPGQVPGYPLGSDEFGRDVFSRLLWAIRPTLMIVIAVSLLRLFLGTSIGLLIGWSRGRAARLLATVTALGLAVPVLLVAVMISTALMNRLGIWAFILGLTLTGWAETARVVRQQTQMLKGQTFIEAARALGAPDSHIVDLHILPHVLSYLWMLLAFEISNVLLVLAGLGFMGYYVGGSVWLETDQETFVRYGSRPELGEMLGSNLSDIFVGPWRFIAAGTMVIVIALGFNLLGEGLRRRSLSGQRRASRFDVIGHLVQGWLDRWLPTPVAQRAPRLGVLLFILLLFVGTLRYSLELNGTDDAPSQESGIAVIATPTIRSQTASATHEPAQTTALTPTAIPIERVLPENASLAIPGGQLWVNSRHDVYGSLRADSEGPQAGEIAWEWVAPEPLVGAPAIASDGTLYLASKAGILYAVSTDGRLLWEADSGAPSAAMPSLDAGGRVFVSHTDGSLSALSRDGVQQWRLDASAIQGSVDGGYVSEPVVAADGTIYYTVASDVVAVASDGTLLWQTKASAAGIRRPPQLNGTQEWILLDSLILDRQTGATVAEWDSTPSQFLVAPNGQDYVRQSYSVGGWSVDAMKNPRFIPSYLAWDSPVSGEYLIYSAGFTFDGLLWLNASSSDRGSVLMWVDNAGFYKRALYAWVEKGLFSVADRTGSVYTCGLDGDERTRCLAFSPESTEAMWEVPLPRKRTFAGAALASNHLYVTTQEGTLYALATVPN